MRECPKCGELNGENNARCYKCNTFIGAISNTKKKCLKCDRVYSGNKDSCDDCGTNLVIYDENYYKQQYSKTDSNTWMYICTIIIPLIGIILGCIKMSNDKRNDSGKHLIILGVTLTAVYPILIVLLMSCG